MRRPISRHSGFPLYPLTRTPSLVETTSPGVRHADGCGRAGQDRAAMSWATAAPDRRLGLRRIVDVPHRLFDRAHTGVRTVADHRHQFVIRQPRRGGTAAWPDPPRSSHGRARPTAPSWMYSMAAALPITRSEAENPSSRCPAASQASSGLTPRPVPVRVSPATAGDAAELIMGIEFALRAQPVIIHSHYIVLLCVCLTTVRPRGRQTDGPNRRDRTLTFESRPTRACDGQKRLSINHRM